VPGLVDLHTHVYRGGTSLGVDPLRLARGGCTTLVDAGSAGPGNYVGFLEQVIRPASPVRVLAFLNVRSPASMGSPVALWSVKAATSG
jgi:dihydroorotase